MTEPPQPVYRPGDVANGYILGADNQWHPVQPPNETPARFESDRLLMQSVEGLPSVSAATAGGQVTASYRVKFKRRWRKCWLVMVCVSGVVAVVNLVKSGEFGGPPIAWIIDLGSETILGGTLYALIVCLIVAIFPGKQPPAAGGTSQVG